MDAIMREHQELSSWELRIVTQQKVKLRISKEGIEWGKQKDEGRKWQVENCCVEG